MSLIHDRIGPLPVCACCRGLARRMSPPASLLDAAVAAALGCGLGRLRSMVQAYGPGSCMHACMIPSQLCTRATVPGCVCACMRNYMIHA